MRKINIAFGIHNHQPVGNFDFVFEQAFQKAYLPFLELLERYPKIRMAQHYSGILFQWIKDHKPEFMPKFKNLVDSGQIEVMTGGFYEPIMSVIPYRDKLGQIEKLTDFVKEATGYTPVGMWLAERIWEPHLAKPIHEAGVRYVVLDDAHFKNAGLQDEELLGYYITEEEGAEVYLFPISENLRYTIPFQAPEATIDYLRSVATEDGNRLVVFADDGEKFGVWPGTYEHCYKDGWLERFFQTLEDNADWINIVHFSEALQELRALGRIYLPTASYREMMEWAMPTRAIHAYEQFEETLKRAHLHDRYKVFVRGGFWRNFMAKYPEANNMHKKMLHLSKRLLRLEKKYGSSAEYIEAQDHLWAGQCNCPYWHGVFGGLYLNHLRFATYRELILGERILDSLERDGDHWVDYQKHDYDCDGSDEIVLRNDVINLYLAPESGGTLFELDYKPKAINLLDTMTRREESYHKKLLEMSEGKQDEQKEGIASIHDMIVVKEEGLQHKLHYDWYKRNSLVDHFLMAGTTLDEFSRSNYCEAGDFVQARFASVVEQNGENLTARIWRRGQVDFGPEAVVVDLQKEIMMSPGEAKLLIDYRVKNLDSETRSFWFGSEFDFALLAGDAEDRYYVFPEQPLSDPRLRSTGEIKMTNEVQLVDEWLGLRITLQLQKPATVWRFPIETISQSESGFERVYQSSVVFPSWRFELTPMSVWENRIILDVEDFKEQRS